MPLAEPCRVLIPARRLIDDELLTLGQPPLLRRRHDLRRLRIQHHRPFLCRAEGHLFCQHLIAEALQQGPPRRHLRYLRRTARRRDIRLKLLHDLAQLEAMLDARVLVGIMKRLVGKHPQCILRIPRHLAAMNGVLARTHLGQCLEVQLIHLVAQIGHLRVLRPQFADQILHLGHERRRHPGHFAQILQLLAPRHLPPGRHLLLIEGIRLLPRLELLEDALLSHVPRARVRLLGHMHPVIPEPPQGEVRRLHPQQFKLLLQLLDGRILLLPGHAGLLDHLHQCVLHPV